MVVYEKGDYRVAAVTYQCHPETCAHWDHPPYAIEHRGNGYPEWQWHGIADCFAEAKIWVDALVAAEDTV